MNTQSLATPRFGKRFATLLSIAAVMISFAGNVYATDPKTGEIWLDKCARCHGDTGRADTPLGRKLKIVDYSSKTAQDRFTDQHIQKFILEGKVADGKTLMPAYKDDLSESEVKELTAYIRKLGK